MERQEDMKDKTDFEDLGCGSDFCVSDQQEETEELNCGSDFRLTKSSPDDSDLSVSHKLRCTTLNTDEATQALSSLQISVDNFLEETTDALFQYIHSADFKSRVLQDIEIHTRFTIERELDSRIEKATLFWQQENIPRIFTSHISQTLTENFIEIHKSLHNIKDNMRGFKSPFDVEDKLGSVLLSLVGTSGTSVAGSVAMMYMSVSPRARQALAAAGVVSGLVVTGLVIGVFDDYETVLKNAYKARINKLSKPKKKQTLRKTYEERFINIIQSYREGYC
ncbi:uncharacterized protein LOC134255466 [Saccostrea cucullata]|uniref:uncharacterized protein LOC134255466 n=1 Tax=Saccostrea cuccullata TaxID=36930 RepID=UPI002ECFE2A6